MHPHSLPSLGILLLFAAALLGGCLDQPKPDCEQGACPSRPTDLPLPRTRDVGFQFLNCTELIVPFDVPKSLVEPMIPAGLEPIGLTFNTAALSVLVNSCPRVVGNDSDYGATQQFWTFAFVHPLNASWGERGVIDYYILDYTTSSKELAARLNGLGLPAEVAQYDHAETPLPVRGRLVTWDVTAANFTAHLDYRAYPDSPQWAGGDFNLWFGKRPLKRVSLHLIDHVETLIATGDLQVQGDSKIGRAIVSPAQIWRGTNSDDITNLWSVSPHDYYAK